MDTVVLIGLMLGLFGGFHTTTSAIRSHFKDIIKGWFETARRGIGELEELKPDSNSVEDEAALAAKKVSPIKARANMDYWLNVWRFANGVPLVAFSIFSIGLSVSCAWNWEQLFVEESSWALLPREHYGFFIGGYTVITVGSLIVALAALYKIRTSFNRLDEDCQTAMGSGIS